MLPLLLVKRFAFDLELLAVSRSLGFARIEEQPIDLHYRFTGSGVGSLAVLRALVDTAAIFYRLRVLRYYERKRRLLGPLRGDRARCHAPLCDLARASQRLGLVARLPDRRARRPERRCTERRRSGDGRPLAFAGEGAVPAGNWLSATVPFLRRGGGAPRRDPASCPVAPAPARARPLPPCRSRGSAAARSTSASRRGTSGRRRLSGGRDSSSAGRPTWSSAADVPAHELAGPHHRPRRHRRLHPRDCRCRAGSATLSSPSATHRRVRSPAGPHAARARCSSCAPVGGRARGLAACRDSAASRPRRMAGAGVAGRCARLCNGARPECTCRHAPVSLPAGWCTVAARVPHHARGVRGSACPRSGDGR